MKQLYHWMGQSLLPLQPYPQFVCLEKNSERYNIIVGPPQEPPLLSNHKKLSNPHTNSIWTSINAATKFGPGSTVCEKFAFCSQPCRIFKLWISFLKFVGLLLKLSWFGKIIYLLKSGYLLSPITSLPAKPVLCPLSTGTSVCLEDSRPTTCVWHKQWKTTWEKTGVSGNGFVKTNWTSVPQTTGQLLMSVFGIQGNHSVWPSTIKVPPSWHGNQTWGV